VDTSYSGHYGVKVASGTTAVTDAQIHSNIDGIGVTSGTITVASSFIFDNTGYGAIASGAPTSTMTNNFWGGWNSFDDGNPSTDNSGPYNSATNPGGAGNEISSYITYNPYTTSTSYLIPTSELHPSAVNETKIHPREMWVGSSTQYQANLDWAIHLWNSSSSPYVRIIDSSSTVDSSTWDMYVTDINDPSNPYPGEYVATARHHISTLTKLRCYFRIQDVLSHTNSAMH